MKCATTSHIYFYISRFFVLVGVLFVFNFSYAQTLTDSLENLLRSDTLSLSEQQRFTVLSDLCWEFYYTDIDRSFSYAQQETKLARRIGNDSLLATAFNDLGRSYFRIGNYDSAKVYYQHAFELRKKLNDRSGMAAILMKQGILFSFLHQFEKSIVYHQKSIDIYESLNDSLHAALVQNNLSQDNLTLGNLEEARKNAEWSRDYFKSIGYDDGLAVAYNNLSLYYSNKNDLATSNTYLLKVATLFHKMEYVLEEASSYNNIGSNFSKLNQHDSSLVYHLKAYEIVKNSEHQHDKALFASNVGLEYLELKQLKQAKVYLDSAYIPAVENGFPEALLNACRGLYEYYKASSNPQDWKKADAYIQQFITLKDSVYDEEKHRNISELQLKYETEKKNKELLQKENENAAIQLNLEQKKRQIYLISGMGIIALLVVGFIFYRKQQQNKLRVAQIRVEEQQKGLKAIIHAEEEQRQQIARDLHDSVGQSLSALKLKLKQLQSGDQQVKESLEIADEVYQDVRTISHQMMPATLNESGLSKAMDQLLSRAFENTPIGYIFDEMIAERRFESDMEVAIFRVTQELVANVIKHAHANKVEVQLYAAGKHLILMFQDNGVGLKNDHDAGDGMGLRGIRMRVEAVNGTFSMEPGDGEDGGTLAIVKIPVNS